MIRRQIEMPVTAERLWEALTDPEQLSGWFGALVDWELHPGGEARFQEADGSERHGRVDDVRPERHLRFTWWPASDPTDTSEVSYLLEPTAEGTRLTIQERRVTRVEDVAVRDSVGWSAWDARLLGAWGDVSMRAGTGARA
jgi:uncharacterized protein YndB with AHSA1/START domain